MSGSSGTGIAAVPTGVNGRGSTWLRGAVVALMVLGAATFAVHVAQPIDGRTNRGWRETDLGGIARNFSREGMRILYPQVDWRGDGPGYAESEFPLYPYLIAIGYRTIGFHEQIGRVLSWLFTLGTLFLVLQLAMFVLPPPVRLPGTIATGLFFIVAPLTNRIATAIQPESLMMIAYVGAVYAFVRWLDDDRWWWYGWTLALTALAILAKLPAAHIGIVFVFLLLWRQGLAAFRRVRLWVLAVASMVPGILWYVHAHQFWLEYGNSLGVSNHRHLIGLASVTSLDSLRLILGIDVPYIWTAAGVLTVVVALAAGPWLEMFGYGVLWYAAVIIYYLVIAGTSTGNWAEYYHVVSVPPIALLFGAAIAALTARVRVMDVRSRRLALAALVVIGLVALIAQRVSGSGSRVVVGVAVVAVVVASLWTRLRRATRWPNAYAATTGLLAGLGVVSVLSATRQTIHEAHPTAYVGFYDAAERFAPLIPPGGLIAVSGEACTPREESAGNMPWFLYWTDHRGFNLCADSQTVGGLEKLAARGARYFIEDRAVSARAPAFDPALRTRFPVMAETPVAVLFDIRDTTGRATAGRDTAFRKAKGPRSAARAGQ